MATSLSGLHPYVKEKTEHLIVNANKRLTGDYEMRITQAFRSKKEQDALYAQGRTKPGKVVTNAPGGKSMHNYGLAIDFALFTRDGKKVVWDTVSDFDKDGKADWMEVVEEAKKLGFEWGGDWRGFKDCPHFQMTAGLTDKQVYLGVVPKFPSVQKESVPVKKPTTASKVTPKPIVPYPGIILKEGAKGMKVIDIKRVQRASGMPEKDVNGKFDAKTTKAVKTYQKRQGLSPDGRVGVLTWNRMF